jgi:hypothetical protein
LEENCSKVSRIEAETRRLKTVYSRVNPKKKKIIDGLIHRAAYMRITLEEYEEDINQNGSVEMFSQSESQEPYERERPVARLYNSMNKNYQSIIKQLSDNIPDEPPKNQNNPIAEFMKGKSSNN